MQTEGTFSIQFIGPNDLRSSYDFYRQCRFQFDERFGAAQFVRAFVFRGIPLVVRIAIPQKPDRKRLLVKWNAAGETGAADLKKHVRRMLYADFDLNLFYRKHIDKNLRRLVSAHRGFRPILTPTVFEAAAWAIIGQQVTMNFASLIKNRLIVETGRTLTIDGETYRMFPEPDDILKLSANELRAMQLSQRKAEYFLGLSELVGSGQLPLENIAAVPYEQAMETLLAVRGIGPWTANYILLRGAGQRDALPIGDAGLHRAVKLAYGQNAVDARSLTALGEKWRPYRSLATFYLWKSLFNGAHT